ncbi:MAG: RagB/SusD family nutrient uptake outer membrane protein [Saprospiraceae bacterium]|nr:RagB/SusD family nutrient uptake outer membrane protein [Saprospiraceae bacterium]
MKYSSFFLSVGFLAALLLTPACDKFHNDIQPADNLPTGAVYQSAADLESALNGVYNSLQSDDLSGLNLILIPEILGGNATWLGSGNPELTDLVNRDLRSSNFYAEGLWTQAYKTINLANAVLGALGTVQDPALTPDLRNRIEGEALFLRGYLYFELVRYFGQVYGDNTPENGVPLLTGAILKTSDLQFPSRASVQQVYDQATADLTQARDLLLATQPSDRANPGAALALLARIAFQKGEYAQAAAHCQTLLDNPAYALTATPQDFFTDEASAEIIWRLRHTPADIGSLAFWFHESADYISIGNPLKTAFGAVVTPAQTAAAQSEGLVIADLRAAMPLISADTNFTNKYEDIAAQADDVPLARLAEFVLMRAEALVRAGELSDGIALLNEVRARSLRVRDAAGNEPPDKQALVLFAVADFPDTGALIDAIVLERRVELCFEGNHFQDMIRLQRDIEGLRYDDCRLRLPIPQREVDVNKNLRQNAPCY